MGLECSGKIYKFSDGMEVVAPPLTVGDYLALASEYMTNVTEKNMVDKTADVYVAQFAYLIKDVIGQTFSSNDFKQKFILDYVKDLYKYEDEQILNNIEDDTVIDIKPILRKCVHCGETMELYLQPSMTFVGYEKKYCNELYKIPKSILPSKGIPYPENTEIWITPLSLLKQEQLKYCNQEDYYLNILEGIYLSKNMIDKKWQLLFADVQNLDLLRRLFVFDINRNLIVKNYICGQCGKYNDISFKIDEIKFEAPSKEMFEPVKKIYKKSNPEAKDNSEEDVSEEIKNEKVYYDEEFNEYYDSENFDKEDNEECFSHMKKAVFFIEKSRNSQNIIFHVDAMIEITKAYIASKEYVEGLVDYLQKQNNNVIINELNLIKEMEDSGYSTDEILEKFEELKRNQKQTNISALHRNPKQGRKLDL